MHHWLGNLLVAIFDGCVVWFMPPFAVGRRWPWDYRGRRRAVKLRRRRDGWDS